MQLDVESLRAFAPVLETGGMTRAAERLGISQSAVSWKIKRLEERIGRDLLVRHGRSLRPSRDGEELLRFELSLFHDWLCGTHLGIEFSDWDGLQAHGRVPWTYEHQRQKNDRETRFLRQHFPIPYGHDAGRRARPLKSRPQRSGIPNYHWTHESSFRPWFRCDLSVSARGCPGDGPVHPVR